MAARRNRVDRERIFCTEEQCEEFKHTHACDCEKDYERRYYVSNSYEYSFRVFNKNQLLFVPCGKDENCRARTALMNHFLYPSERVPCACKQKECDIRLCSLCVRDLYAFRPHPCHRCNRFRHPSHIHKSGLCGDCRDAMAQEKDSKKRKREEE